MPLRSSFAIRKTKPRKGVSRSPLKFAAEELARELGPRYQTIDVRIGNQRLVYDIAQSGWASGGTVGTPISSRGILNLETTKRDLEEDNHALRTKIGALLEMLTEVIAEQDVRPSG